MAEPTKPTSKSTIAAILGVIALAIAGIATALEQGGAFDGVPVECPACDCAAVEVVPAEVAPVDSASPAGEAVAEVVAE